VLIQGVWVGDFLIKRGGLRSPVELGGGSQDVGLAVAHAATAGFEELNGVVGDVARRDLLAGHFDAVEHLGGDGDTVLDEFFHIFRSYGMDGSGDGCLETGDDFVEQYETGLRGHKTSDQSGQEVRFRDCPEPQGPDKEWVPIWSL
jgi:hypothetical protein